MPSEDNPADIISRGLGARDLMNNELWWNGPKFLKEKETNILYQPVTVITDTVYLKELETFAGTNLNLIKKNNFIDTIVNSTNNFSKIIRIVSFIFRLSYNATQPKKPKVGRLKIEELNHASDVLVRLVQRDEIVEEIACLTKNKDIKHCKLSNLNPFFD